MRNSTSIHLPIQSQLFDLYAMHYLHHAQRIRRASCKATHASTPSSTLSLWSAPFPTIDTDCEARPQHNQTKYVAAIVVVKTVLSSSCNVAVSTVCETMLGFCNKSATAKEIAVVGTIIKAADAWSSGSSLHHLSTGILQLQLSVYERPPSRRLSSSLQYWPLLCS